MSKRKTKDALEIIDRELVGDDEDLRGGIEEERLNFRVAQMIYDARKEANLTQTELAKLVGTTQSVISLLESADYDGHSLSMLQRIASALGKEIQIKFEVAEDQATA